MKININGNLVEVDVEAFNKAVEDKSESFEIKSDGLVIRTTEQQAVFETNLKKEVGDYKVEVGRKEVLSGLGLEIEGKGYHKDLAKSIDAINAFVGVATSKALEDAGKAPDGKIKEHLKDIEALRGDLLKKDTEIADAKGEFSNYKKNQRLSNTIIDNMPDNLILPKKDIMSIVSGQIKLDVNDNGQVFGYGQDGEPLKDSNRSIISGEAIVKSFFEENPQYSKTVTGGAGGGDSTGSGSSTDWDSFVKTQQEAGNSPASDEFRTAQANAVASGALVL